MSDGDDFAIVDSSVIVGLIIGDLGPTSQLRYQKAISQHRCAITDLIRQESIAKLSQHYKKRSEATRSFDAFTSDMVVFEESEDVMREAKALETKHRGTKISPKLAKDIEIAATAIVYDCPVITDDRDFQRIRSRDKRLRLITERSPVGARYLSKGKDRA